MNSWCMWRALGRVQVQVLRQAIARAVHPGGCVWCMSVRLNPKLGGKH